LRNKKSFSYSVFEKIKPYLNQKTITFFEQKYNKYKNVNIRESGLFNNNYDNNEEKIQHSIYLRNESNFNHTKEQLKLTIFSEANFNIFNDINDNSKKYDVILLSNIIEYSHKYYPSTTEHTQLFKNNVITPFINNLSQKGTIICFYIFDSSNDNKSVQRNIINKHDERLKLYSNIQNLLYEEYHFKSALSNCRTDCITLLTRE